MNINRFDTLLINVNHSVARFCDADQGNRNIYKPIYRHDVATLTRQYLSVRRILIQNCRPSESDITLTHAELLRAIHYLPKTKCPDFNLKSIAHELFLAACFLNKEILRLLNNNRDQSIPGVKKVLSKECEDSLAKAIFIPICMLEAGKFKFIKTILEQMDDLSSLFKISIVGSQALYALLITLDERHNDPRQHFEFMASRDLDIKILMPKGAKTQEFKSYTDLIMTRLHLDSKLKPEPVDTPTLKYWTYTDRDKKIDVVLTNDERQFSNCSVNIALFSNRMFLTPDSLIALNRGQIVVPALGQCVDSDSIPALAFVSKLLNILSPWGFRLASHHQHDWDRISPESSEKIQSMYTRKYLPTEYSKKQIASVPPEMTEEEFPSLTTTTATPHPAASAFAPEQSAVIPSPAPLTLVRRTVFGQVIRPEILRSHTTNAASAHDSKNPDYPPLTDQVLRKKRPFS